MASSSFDSLRINGARVENAHRNTIITIVLVIAADDFIQEISPTKTRYNRKKSSRNWRYSTWCILIGLNGTWLWSGLPRQNIFRHILKCNGISSNSKNILHTTNLNWLIVSRALFWEALLASISISLPLKFARCLGASRFPNYFKSFRWVKVKAT